MRSFILLVTFFSLVILKPVHASQTRSDSIQLFSIVETFDSIISDGGDSVQTPNLDQKIRIGMQDLLVRLTGDSSILSKAEAQPFIKQPKSWLSTYRFEPRKEDGVTIGQNLVLDFDSRRLLKAFQNAHIQIWPSSERPATLLMGRFKSSGSVLNLNSETLSYRPDIDFRSYPKLLALPYAIASKQARWVSPTEVDSSAVQALLAQSQQPYLLNFQIEQQSGEAFHLVWTLFNREGGKVDSASLKGDALQPLMQAMFNRIIAIYSFSYRQSAGVLSTATVSFNDLMSAEQLIDIEAFLKSKKPVVHQVFLQKVTGDRADFQVVYQGQYEEFLRLAASVDNSVLLDESALTGEINLRLRGLGVMPTTQLIDLSKEFEANAHQER